MFMLRLRSIRAKAIPPLATSILLPSSYRYTHNLFDEMPQRTDRYPSNTPGIAHCIAIKTASISYLPTTTSILSYYSKAGDFVSSFAVFNETVCKDVIFYNAMITTCIQHGFCVFGLRLFCGLVELGSGFDSTSLLLAVSVLSRLNWLRLGCVVHGLCVKSGMVKEINLGNGLIDMYAKRNELGSAETVFDEVGGNRDVVSWNSVMSGCVYNENNKMALQYFREMVCDGAEIPDAVTLSCAVAAATSLGEISFGLVIHSLGFKIACDPSMYTSVGNALISFYSECEDVEAACDMFREIVDKDVVSWNAMISTFAVDGSVGETLYLLKEMWMEGFQPDSVTLVSVASLCSELMLLREGRMLHGYVIHGQLGSELPVVNSLIDMYSKCKSIQEAEILFRTNPGNDLVSWNTMISGYSHNGLFEEAQKLFKSLLRQFTRCSLSTLLAILPSCASLDDLNFGKSIHCWQIKAGFSANILANNSLIHMYMCCGDYLAALSLLQSISSVADVASWNTVIVGYIHNGYFEEALETFGLLRQQSDISCDSTTFVNAITACGNLTLASQGKALHALSVKTARELDIRAQNSIITMYGRCGDVDSAVAMFCSSPEHNLCSWNCMISAFCHNNDGGKALRLFCCLDQEPDEITIACILSACNQLGMLRHGKQIHGFALRNGLLNSFISASLLNMYSNCGRLDIAVRIFRNLREKTIIAWNSMISAYGYHGNGKKAADLFNDMCKSGIKPTSGSFVSVLSACSHSGLVNEGICYYNDMLKKYGVEPLSDHHVCIIEMLGRSGKLHEALDFIKNLQNPLEPGVLGALLSSCNYHGNIEIGREVANLLFDLEPSNVGYYISLSNLYVRAGGWEDAVKLRSTVENKQLKKQTSYSLIDVGLG